MTDFAASKEEFELLCVPHFSASHWSICSGWELAEALDGVLLDRVRELVRGARFVAISMDECVGIDKKSRLSLHVYVLDAEWSRVPLLIDVAHLRGTPDAENITQLVLDTLSVYAGLAEADMARKLVAVSTDGASVMTGVHNGVSARLSQTAPYLVSIHCMAHRTDLAVGALERAPIVKEILGVIKDAYSYFAFSAKRVGIFTEAAEEAGTAGNRMKRIVDTRWICALVPARTLLAEYRALLVLFYEEDERLYNMLRDARVYVAMHALMPALQSVDVFIKLCQSRELYIGELAKALQRLRDRLREMYLAPATRYKTVEFADYMQLLPVNGDITGTCWVHEGDSDLERIGLTCGGEFYPFTAVPHRAGRDRTPAPLTPELLSNVITSVQDSMSAAVEVLVAELTSRFPPQPLLEAASIVYSEYWEARPAIADFKAKLQTIKDYYCRERVGPDGTKVPPMLDSAVLDAQQATFVSAMTELATEQRLKRAREQTQLQRQALADPDGQETKRAHRTLLDDTPTSRLWQRISNAACLAGGLTEFAALAQLVFVMVPGSVEDERRFSAMAYLQDPTRNRLDEHLALCVRMFTQDLFDLRTFPFEAALKKWMTASSRGRYMMNR